MSDTPEATEQDGLRDFMQRLARDPDAKPPEGMHVHITEKREPCDHEWNNGGDNPEYCLK